MTRTSARIRLEGPADFAGFRRSARLMLLAGRAPHEVAWDDGGSPADLFAGGDGDDPGAGRPATADAGDASPAAGVVPHVSRAFLAEAASAALHGDGDRFDLLYRILWRLVREPKLLALASDPDMVRLARMAKAVRRDIHKMHAFVRFKEIGGEDGGEAFVAFYEPDHHVVEAAAPFFARRFASLRWTILTPRRSAHWTGDAVVFGPGAPRDAAPTDDALEALWRSYYASIFNPARVNPGAMKAEMPVRFWRNLPEAPLIAGLVAGAPRRAAAMVAAMATEPVSRRGAETPPEVPLPAADGLAGVAAALSGCRSCPLWEHATQPVAGQGPQHARLMIVGEQPGDEEDIAGRPFIGPAGRVLDRALGEAGLDRATVYLTNAVKHFKFAPRGRRRIHKRPEAAEIHACLPWLDREIQLVDPEVVLMLGASAARAVLGRSLPVTQERGRAFPLPDGSVGVIATHPAYVLRLDGQARARDAYADLVDDLVLGGRCAGLLPHPEASANRVGEAETGMSRRNT